MYQYINDICITQIKCNRIAVDILILLLLILQPVHEYY